MPFAIKTEIRDEYPSVLIFSAQKTMYGGKKSASGDTIFIFASENEGGQGLIARGIVTAAKPCPQASQMRAPTPRVDITINRTAVAKRPLGRSQLKPFKAWDDGQPETEINFKFYRQATNK